LILPGRKKVLFYLFLLILTGREKVLFYLPPPSPIPPHRGEGEEVEEAYPESAVCTGM
jgi:hypothetical protein